MFTINIVPGQGFMPFWIYKSESGMTETGRQKAEAYAPKNEQFYGILTNASQSEVDQQKQKGHPITHKITQYGAMVKAGETDLLVTEDGRQFYIESLKNPANLDVTMIYYVSERYDIKYEKSE